MKEGRTDYGVERGACTQLGACNGDGAYDFGKGRLLVRRGRGDAHLTTSLTVNGRLCRKGPKFILGLPGFCRTVARRAPSPAGNHKPLRRVEHLAGTAAEVNRFGLPDFDVEAVFVKYGSRKGVESSNLVGYDFCGETPT